jgi:WD40 repeat protein
LVCRGFHSGSISAIDIAIQRPILVTCSRDDSTIRLWNYYNFSCELAREYYVLEDMAIREAAKPLISVAMHPSGYYMAASFIDKIRFYHILHDELRHFKNIELKNCQKMKFSSGGHLFLAVANKTIQIFNSYTLMRLANVGSFPLGVSDIVMGEKD